MLLFMLASGLTLIFGMMGVLNFAHAAFYMLGAYFAYTISLYTGFWPGAGGGPAGRRAAGGARPSGTASAGAPLRPRGRADLHVRRGHRDRARSCSSSGAARPRATRCPRSWTFRSSTSSAAASRPTRPSCSGISAAIFLFLFAILTRTRAGLIIQASLTHPGMVGMLGHNVPRVFMIVFGIGSGAGRAGRRHRRTRARHLPRHGPGARQHRVRGRRHRRPGLADRRLRRLAPHRHRADLRGRPRTSRSATWPARSASPSRACPRSTTSGG